MICLVIRLMEMIGWFIVGINVSFCYQSKLKTQKHISPCAMSLQLAIVSYMTGCTRLRRRQSFYPSRPL